MLKIHNPHYSKKKLVVGNYGILEFDENGDTEANKEIAFAVKGLKGFVITDQKPEIQKEPVREVEPEKVQETKLPKFDSEIMSKTWLEDFGKRIHGIDIDKRKSAMSLYRSLKKLEKEQAE